MPALLRLQKINLRRHVAFGGQVLRRQKRIVFGIEQQGRHFDFGQPRPGGCLRVIVVFIGKPVHRRGVGIVECAQAADFFVGLRHFGEQSVQEIRRVQQIRQTVLQCFSRRIQVHGRGNGGGRFGQCGSTLLAQIFGQHVAAQRPADHIQFAIALRQQVEHMRHFARVAAVVHPLGRHAAARTEMRHHAVPAALPYGIHHFHCVMAAAAAFQTVQQHHAGRVLMRRIDKIVCRLIFAVAVGQKFAAVIQVRTLQHFAI